MASTTTTTTPPLFCSFDPSVEALLGPLHARLRAGDRTLQAVIDRHLFAVQSPRLRNLVLPRHTVPHYDNLPDLSHFALGIIDPSRDALPEYQQIHLLLRQCTPLRRRTKRAQRELQWQPESMRGMQVLVRCMQGTLLGLYPSCSRPVAFGTRVQAIRLLRTLLVSEFDTLHAAMQRIRYITKLCVMEHLCNTIRDYHPGLRHMLDKSGQQVQHFCNAVCTMCDTFRGELNAAHAAHGCIMRAMLHLERNAHSFFERCTRAYRGIITAQCAAPSSAAYLKKHPLVPDMALVHALDTVYPCANQFIFDIVHRGMLPTPLLQAAWHITQSIRVHALPDCVRETQLRALRRRFQEDHLCVERCRRIHLCVFCAVRRKSPCAAQKRHDCVGGALVCKECNLHSVLEVDILGRIAQIGDHMVLLSSCCGALVTYSGGGMEFGANCGPHCAASALSCRQGRGRQDASLRPPVVVCRMCGQRSVQQTFEVLCLATRALIRVGLCMRHRLHADIVATIGDEQDLEKAMALNVAAVPLLRGPPARR